MQNTYLRSDFDLVEDFSVVDTNDGANHLRDDNHVAEVSLDNCGLLVGLSLLTSLAELLDETHRATLQTALKASSGTSMNKLDKLLGLEVQQVLEVDSAESEGPELSLLAVLCRKYKLGIRCR